MTAVLRFADSDSSFSELVMAIRAQVDPECRLPDWPFKMPAVRRDL